MKIGIQTWGSEGDINPFIALASGLSKAGHNVTLAVTCSDRKDFKALAEKLGFKLGTVDYIGENEETLNMLGKKMIEEKNPLVQLKFIFEKMFLPGVHSMFDTANQLVSENDLIIGHFIHYPLQCACEKAGKPYITVSLNHGAIPTKHYPPVPFPNLGKTINTWLWKLTEKMINKAILGQINTFRISHGLKEVNTFRTIWESPLLNLIAVSPVLSPPTDDWSKNNKVCGFFNLDDYASKWELPKDFEIFLDNVEPPVYFTLGSMTGTENNALYINETTKLMYDAAKLAGCRAIIQSRWEYVKNIPEDKSIFKVNSAPYTRVFPKCKAVVHHGGAGTTQTATLCGTPSIIIAHIQDQFLWGHQLKKLGIGGKVLSRQTVTSEKIAAEIRKITNDPNKKEKAIEIGKVLATENGVKNAIKYIEEISIILKQNYT
ncbi:glycosyltransferase [Flavobacterium sp. RSSA_27]|uniref:glycosyltransferase n=1 Tax=Flavobacterium sp. RSSA_27 TaxID=3447667 RepID=UPI003F38CAA0